MFCSILSAAISGVNAVPVDVEADVSDGMPIFTMVGFISSQVKEAQERVRTALRNHGLALPPKRITLNLAPGDLRKNGTRFDLPIAAAILRATEQVPGKYIDRAMIIGELHLDGTIGKVNGILPSVLMARERGITTCIIPLENLEEGLVVDGMHVIGLHSLSDFVQYCRTGEVEKNNSNLAQEKKSTEMTKLPDFSDIHGQQLVKRAALIAAAGFHNLLLSGPPGSGKSMTAERIPTIMPRLTQEESLEISKIYSVCGMLPEGEPIISNRPFRAPHHTISPTALCGGGKIPTPGEVTLSHRGVLFLDEFPEMHTATLEMLRQPLENRKIQIARLDSTQVFPASFLLVAAMNPCPCGYFPNRNRCNCTIPEIRGYQARISQAMLDRIDLRCTVAPVSYEELSGINGARRKNSKEDLVTSEEMRQMVERACQRQKDRYASHGIVFNSELSSSDIDRYCVMTDEARRVLRQAFQAMGLSARGYHHVIKVAKTLADLEDDDYIREIHISEALCFRNAEGESHV